MSTLPESAARHKAAAGHQNQELQWSDQEKKDLEQRILSLRYDQVGALMEISGLGFGKDKLDTVIRDIMADGLKSGHLEIVLAEATSKEDFLWWIRFFEQHRS